MHASLSFHIGRKALILRSFRIEQGMQLPRAF